MIASSDTFTPAEQARLEFLRWAIQHGIIGRDDRQPTRERVESHPELLSWYERARIYGVQGLERRWWSGEFRSGIPIPTEAYLQAIRDMYGDMYGAG